MKLRLLLLAATGLLTGVWLLQDLFRRDPAVLTMGIVIGLLLGAVATIPGHLVLLATLRRQQGQELPWLKTWEATGPRPGRTRRRAENAPAIYLLPAERRAATPTAPPDTLGAWYSPGPDAYDLEWNDPPVVTSDGP